MLAPPAREAKPAECEVNCAHHLPVRLSWAKLLRRVFDLDLQHCSNCGGELKIVVAILEHPVIEKIFGAVLGVAAVDSAEEALAVTNDSVRGLADAVFSGDADRAERIAERIEAGTVLVNCAGMAQVEGPWGGFKSSGWVRELGR
jgi:hypothetical protein